MSADYTLDEAMDCLTGWEIVAIEAKFGRMDTLGIGQLMISTVWAYENRSAKTDWQEIGARTQRELVGYFKSEEVADVDGAKRIEDGG